MADYYSEQADSSAPPAKRMRGDNRICPQDDVIVLKEKVMIPVERHPGYNFVGSIIGPKGSILKELQAAFNAKIAVFGQGSIRDKAKEKELLDSGEDKYKHFTEPLHVLIDIKAPRADAHRRMANALLEIYKFMTPNGQGGGQQGPPIDGGYGGGYGGGYSGGDSGGYGGPQRGRGGPPRGGRGGPRGGPRVGRGGPRGGRGGPRGGSRGGY